jgi:predicted HicB family RNase H-like nuclease
MNGEIKNELIMVRMSGTLRRKAQAAAKKRGQTLSEWVRALIAEATSGPILTRKRGRRKGM